MAALDVAIQVREALATVRKTDLRDPRLIEVLNLSQQLVDAMQTFFSSIDKSIYGEFRYIAQYIQKAREEIAELRPNDIREQRLPTAGAELAAIVKHTELATNRIMAAAEEIMAGDTADPDFPELVNNKVMEIFEACSFQDITGQRVKKVVETLDHIESRVDRFANVMGVTDAQTHEETERERRAKENILNGPALNGPETQQDDIDAMFADVGPASQDDIDALFA